MSKRVIFDGIIFSLQKAGGISNYFNSLIYFAKSKLSDSVVEVNCFGSLQCTTYPSSFPLGCTVRQSRFLERYRRTEDRVGDVFHSSYYRLPHSSFSGLVVTTVHDFTYELYSAGLRKLVHSRQKQDAIRHSDVIICVSENTKRDLLRFIPNVEKSKIHVVYNGASEIFRNSGGSLNPRLNVLFVGLRSGYKNFIALVHALSLGADFYLTVVGGGKFSNAELQLLNRHIPGRFCHAGLVSDLQLKNLYSSAYALVYPSLYEGFGIPVLEAMMAGCPVVALNSSSIPEVAGDACKLLDSADPDLIHKALMDLMSEDVRRKFIEKGYRQSKNFSWARCAQETFKAYGF